MTRFRVEAPVALPRAAASGAMVGDKTGRDKDEPVGLDIAVDEAVAACNGDPRAAVAALLVTLDATERELEALRVEVARIEAAVSDGYVRGRLRRRDGWDDA